MLSSRAFRLMNTVDRGVCWTIRMECWVIGSLPADPNELGQWLRIDPNEVIMALKLAVPSIFKVENGELTCPELDAHRQRLSEHHANLAAWGSKGGKKATANKGNGHKPSSN